LLLQRWKLTFVSRSRRRKGLDYYRYGGLIWDDGNRQIQPPSNHKIHTQDTVEIRVVKYCFQWSGSIAAPIERYGAIADALTVEDYR